MSTNTFEPRVVKDPTTKTFVVGSDNEPIRPTYGAAAFGISPGTGAAATDLVEFYNPTGSGKVVRFKSIVVSGTVASTLQNVPVALIRRSAADTSGAAVALTPAPHDTADGACLLQCRYFTAPPTPGATVATLHVARLNIAPAAAAGVDRTTNWQFTWQNDKAIVLRAGEYLCLSVAGRTYAAGDLIDFDILFTEEDATP